MIISQQKTIQKVLLFYYFISIISQQKSIQKVNKKPTAFLFINKNPVECTSDAEHLKGKQICENMRVTNDTTERGVALMQEYNRLHTVVEEQREYLMLVVKQNTNKFPNVKK